MAGREKTASCATSSTVASSYLCRTRAPRWWRRDLAYGPSLTQRSAARLYTPPVHRCIWVGGEARPGPWPPEVGSTPTDPGPLAQPAQAASATTPSKSARLEIIVTPLRDSRPCRRSSRRAPQLSFRGGHTSLRRHSRTHDIERALLQLDL